MEPQGKKAQEKMGQMQRKGPEKGQSDEEDAVRKTGWN